MRKCKFLVLLCLAVTLLLAGCSDLSGSQGVPPQTENVPSDNTTPTIPEEKDDLVTYGTESYRGFLLDNVYHSPSDGEIHFNVYIPASYTGNEPYALYFTLPGYEGLYFQGVGVNLRAEAYGFEAQKYNDKMIIVAPQLSDWGMTSARQTVALVRYFLSAYNINQKKVYANGYSGGGETMSQVMGLAPELFTAYLHCSAQWDGDLNVLAQAKTPVYMAIGRNDEYYGSARLISSYEQLVSIYRGQGLKDEEIAKLVVLDVKEADYFSEYGISNQHGGGGYFAYDGELMGWLFGQIKE